MCPRVIKPGAWRFVARSFCSAAATASEGPASNPDKVSGESPRIETLAPGPRYEAGWLTRFFLGSQWRDLWTTPIEAPVLDLQSFDGGLRPERRGGGQQTTSLRLQSGNGHTWSFLQCAKRFVEFTRADVRDGQLTKNKRGYSRIPMKFSLD